MVKARSKECLASAGAIFLCSHLTRKECFEKKIFGLSPSYAEFVEKVKAGTTLFLFDIDQHKLHGVFEATSDGALDIIPDAYISSGQRFPYQIRFKRIWFCKPLMEDEFQDVVHNSFVIRNKLTYHLSHQQVTKLLHLFSSRKRLQPPQNSRSQDDTSREFEISSLVKETDMQSSPNSSSCGSFRSPCQTCSSSTLGEDATSRSHRLIDPLSLVHRVLQSNVSDMTKSSSSVSSLHTGADTVIVTVPRNQEVICDQDTDDFIPLPQEEDVFKGVDDLFGLLEDENRSSESKGSSDSEDCNSFRQACVRKEDGCHLLKVNSRLRSDTESRKSVFSRIVRANEVFNQRKRSKAKAFPQRSAESFNPLYQTKKQRRAQWNKPFPCQNDGVLDKPSADMLRGVQASDNLFIRSGNRRSTMFSVRVEDQNKSDAKWDKSCDKEQNMPQLIAGVQESSEVSVEEGSTPSLNFKRRAKGLKVEGGYQDFNNEDVVEAGQKTSVMAPFDEEHPSDTALIHKGSTTIDILATSDGICKEESSSLASKDTYTQLGRPNLETNVLLHRQKSIEGCFECGEDVTRETPLILGSFRSMDSLTESCGDKKTLSNEETGSHVAADRLGTETYIQEKLNQSASTCNGVANDDKIFHLGKFESIDVFPNRNEDCGNMRSLPSDGSDKLVACCLETEMPLMQKQTPYIQSLSAVACDVKVLVPETEISEVVLPTVDADCIHKGRSLDSDYREEVCHNVRSCHELVPSNASPIPESCGPLNNLPTLHGDSADNNCSLDETSEHVSTSFEVLPQDEHYHSCCGDTSSVLEYTCTGDGSENKNSADQKDDEVLFSVSDSKDHISITYTSSDGNPSFPRAAEKECDKVMLLNEEQCQNFQSTLELAHENSNSVDSFAVSAEGFGSKSSPSAGRTSDHQVTDLLGMSSESRTSFINDSTPTSGSENVEAYAEQPILQHDPGEATAPL